MNNAKNLLLMVEVMANEKGVEQEIVFQALEAALASASKEHYGAEWDIAVTIDRATGEYETARRWTVVDDEDDAVVPTPIRPPVLDDDEDDAELSVPTKAAPVDEDDLEEGEADDADEFEEDGDDDDDMPPPPKSARNAPPKSPAPKPPRKK